MALLCKDSEEFSVKEFTSILKKFSLSGKKALITGGAGGIGRTTAKSFAELGADVALVDIEAKKDDLKRICADISTQFKVMAFPLTGDVAEEDSVKAFVAEAAESLGTIDILHNNAGIILRGDNANVDIKKWNRMVNINLTGMFLVARTTANVMIKDKHGGSIINTASMSAHIVNRTPNQEYGFAYTTTKAGVLHMTKGMAVNYIKYGIRVNSISPGVVISGIHDNVPVEMMQFSVNEVPAKRFGTLDEIAGMVAFLATDLAGFMVGSDILIDGGQSIN